MTRDTPMAYILSGLVLMLLVVFTVVAVAVYVLGALLLCPHVLAARGRTWLRRPISDGAKLG